VVPGREIPWPQALGNDETRSVGQGSKNFTPQRRGKKYEAVDSFSKEAKEWAEELETSRRPGMGPAKPSGKWSRQTSTTGRPAFGAGIPTGSMRGSGLPAKRQYSGEKKRRTGEGVHEKYFYGATAPGQGNYMKKIRGILLALKLLKDNLASINRRGLHPRGHVNPRRSSSSRGVSLGGDALRKCAKPSSVLSTLQKREIRAWTSWGAGGVRDADVISE